MELLITGKVNGQESVNKMLSSVRPEARQALLRWMYKERNDFIGKKGKDGLIRREINKKLTWSGNRIWRSQMTNLFTGKVTDPLTKQVVTPKRIRASFLSGTKGGGAGAGLTGDGVSLTLKMGVMYRTRRKVHEALEALESPHTVNSNKYMPIPVKGGDIGKAHTKFKYWLSHGMFTVVYKNGMAFYFLNSKKGLSSERGRDGELMFIGKKTANVRWSHNFRQRFEQVRPAMMLNGQNIFNSAMAKVAKVK